MSALVRITDESDLVVARRLVRALAEEQGLASPDAEALATAVTEIARNMLVHARAGELQLSKVAEGPRRGVEVVASDEGPGIGNAEKAMQDGYSSVGSLGLGLPSARRMMDTFDLASEVGKGTRIVMRKWA